MFETRLSIHAYNSISYIKFLQRAGWPSVRDRMMSRFAKLNSSPSSHINVSGYKQTGKNADLLSLNMVATPIMLKGSLEKICMKKEDAENLFLSKSFGLNNRASMARIYRIHQKEGVTNAILAKVFVSGSHNMITKAIFHRYLTTEEYTLKVPIILEGYFGSPLSLAGWSIDLRQSVVHIKAKNALISSFKIDISNIEPIGETIEITSLSLNDQLVPGTRFLSQSYEKPILIAYKHAAIGVHALPQDYLDPNFTKRGYRQKLTWSGYWPKQ